MTIRTYLALCVYLNDIDLDSAEEYFGVKPDRFQKKGERSQRGRIVEKSAWFFGTKDKCPEEFLEPHFEWLRSSFEKSAPAFALLKRKGCEINVSVFWETGNSNGGPCVSTEDIDFLASIHANLDFDIWPISD